MSSVYAILESPHKWLILAGIAFTAACVGAIMMLALTWQHGVARAWFYVLFVATLYFLVRAFLDWKRGAETAAIQRDRASKR